MPSLHRVSAFGEAQELSHAPQLAGSDLVSTQVPEQVVGLAEVHELTHSPPMHSGDALGHFLPHAPQLATLVKSVSQNSSSEEEQ